MVALMECIESCGSPASTALTPSIELRLGPIVPPDLESFRIIKRWFVVPLSSATRLQIAVLMLSVVTVQGC